MLKKLNKKIDENKPLIYLAAMGTVTVGSLLILKNTRLAANADYVAYLKRVGDSFVESNGQIAGAVLESVAALTK